MIPLYRRSLAVAKNDDVVDAGRVSFNENVRCKNSLDEKIAKCGGDLYLSTSSLENDVKEFGFDRTMWVIEDTINERSGDGRFKKENVKWAKSLNIPQDQHNYRFALNSHSCFVDCLASDIQKMYAELNLFSGKHIVQSDEPQDYTNKLLILRDTSLKEEYRTPENQLFFAIGGFGCSPTASGRKVFGHFLSDGERAEFCRHDFYGIIADEHIPDWAKEKLKTGINIMSEEDL